MLSYFCLYFEMISETERKIEKGVKRKENKRKGDKREKLMIKKRAGHPSSGKARDKSDNLNSSVSTLIKRKI